MKCKVVGLSFRSIKKKISIGDELLIVHDPFGEKTGQDHTDRNAISLWHGETFVGYVPKNLNTNKFYSVSVSSILFKSPKGRLKDEFFPGDSVASIEIDCKGEFQINGGSGRSYESNDKLYESITQILNKYPSDPDALMRWGINNFNTYDEYREALDGYAKKGTEFHNQVEDFINGKTEDCPENVRRFLASLSPYSVESTESRCFNDELGIAGTCDAIMDLRGERVAMDWKSSKAINTKHRVQVGFYAHANGCKYGQVVAFGAKNKQGYSVSKVDPDIAVKILDHLQEIRRLEKQLIYKR